MIELKLYPHQEVGVKYLLKNNSCILGDEQGLGKTIQVISAVNKLIKAKKINRVLVVCPAIMRMTWGEEFKKYTSYSIEVKKSSTSEIEKSQIVVCSYEYVTSRYNKLNVFKDFDCIVVDESHKIKNIRAKRTKVVLKLIEQPSVKYKWLLSGTPITKGVDDLYTQLRPLGVLPVHIKNVWVFREYFMNKRESYFGTEYYGIKHKEELLELMQRVMLRRKKKDVLKELPLLIHSKVYVDIKSSIAKESLRYVDEIVKSIEEKNGSFLVEHSQHIATVRRDLGISKIKPTVEYILEYLKENEQEKLVVFAYHNDVVEAITEALEQKNIKVAAITGATSMSKREEAIRQFQEPQLQRVGGDVAVKEVQVLVCNLIAAGVGVTLTNAHTEIFAELDWTPANIAQAEARCHRIGQKEDVNVVFLLAKDSIDEHIYKSVVKKLEVIKEVIE